MDKNSKQNNFYNDYYISNLIEAHIDEIIVQLLDFMIILILYWSMNLAQQENYG